MFVALALSAIAGACGATPRGVVLYGGHFSPPHRTHVAEALAACAEVNARRVVFIPSAPRALQHEAARLTPGWTEVPAHRRVAMTWLATRGHPRLEVSSVEAGRPRPGYSSAETILELAGRLEGPVWLLMGTDVLERLPTWPHVEKILARVNVLATEYPPWRLGPLTSYLPVRLAGRYREVAPSTWQGPAGTRILLRRFPTGGVSSGQVRRALEEGRSVDALVPGWVARYIGHFGLYRARATSAPPSR